MKSNMFNENKNQKVIKRINLTGINNELELQNALKIQLELPSFYGKNWDAFWDAITGLIEMPDILIVEGWEELHSKLPREAEIFKNVMRDFNEMYPMLKCQVQYL